MNAFLDSALNISNWILDWVWGWPMIVLLLGTGLYLTILLRGLQFRAMPRAFRLIFSHSDAEGDISHFGALTTALAATVGNGNIVGVASAIAIGGPGAIFWMWMTGLVGMATKYAEAVLAVKYRESGPTGMRGGPMYYISKGTGLRWLGWLFALFAACAAFGIGNMFQVHAVAGNFKNTFQIAPWITGLALLVLTGLVVLGGIRSIARFTSVLVPFMIVGYCGAAILTIALNAERIPMAFELIFKYAFTPSAAMGGTIGSLLKFAIGQGVARGIFSNESGLGSSPIAAAAAKTPDPTSQALVSMTQTFIDTIIVCTMTALVILTAPLPEQIGQHMSDSRTMPSLMASNSLEFVTAGATVPAGTTTLTTKDVLTSLSMERTLGPIGAIIVALASAIFAYSTLLGWCYYGEKSIEYIFGARSIFYYRIAFLLVIVPAALLELQLIINVSDIMNALMAIPNLIALLLLAGVVKRETDHYFRTARAKENP